MDKGQPLWLPKGSVRAILALLVVGSTMAMIGFELLPKLDPEKAFIGLTGFATLVMNAYFIAKVTGNGGAGS